VVQLVKHPETKITALFAAVSAAVLAAVFVFAGRGERPAVPNYRTFRAQVEQATSIWYRPSPLSSRSFVSPIIDAGLLEEAKTILGTARDLLNVPEDLDLSDAEILSASLTLVNAGSDYFEENAYLLYRWNHKWGSKTYVLVSDSPDGSRFIPIAVMDASPDALASAAAREDKRLSHAALCGTFLERVKGAVSIQVEMGDAKSPGELGPITDPQWLEEARAALLTAELPAGTGSPPVRRSEEELRYEAGTSIYAITLTPASGDPATYYIDRQASTNTNYLVVPLEDFPAADSGPARYFARAGVLGGEAGYTLALAAEAANGVLPPPGQNVGSGG